MGNARDVRRFFKTPKGMLILILAVLAAIAAPAEGIGHVSRGLAGAVLVAGLLDVVLIVVGIFITDRVNKMPIVLAFLGVYYALFSATAFVADPRQVAEIFRAPDLRQSEKI